MNHHSSTARTSRLRPARSSLRLGSFAAALLAAAVALGEAIDGAPTDHEQRVMVATGAAAILLTVIAAAAPRSTHRPPATVAVTLVVAAAALTATRLARLVAHIRLGRDEPTTDWSLAAQAALALAALLAIVAISRRRTTPERGQRGVNPPTDTTVRR